MLPRLGGDAASRVDGNFEQVVQDMAHPTTATAIGVLGAGLATVAWAALPIVLLCTAIAVAVAYAQVGLRFTPKALRVDLSRISPRTGFKRIFSPQGVWSLAKTFVKFAVLSLVGYALVHGLFTSVLGGSTPPLSSTLVTAGSTAESLLRDVGVLALVVAAGDYGFQRRQYQQKLRMTKQEVRDELRRTEGAPEMQRARRSKARRLSRMRMMAAVATADAVVVNPTHYAVAIAYDRAKDRAPRDRGQRRRRPGGAHQGTRDREQRPDRREPRAGPDPARRLRDRRRRAGLALHRSGPPLGLRLLALTDGQGAAGCAPDGTRGSETSLNSPPRRDVEEDGQAGRATTRDGNTSSTRTRGAIPCTTRSTARLREQGVADTVAPRCPARDRPGGNA